MSDEKIIEVKVTKEHIEELRKRGISESDLPKVGTIKRYRPSPQIIKEKTIRINVQKTPPNRTAF